MHWRLLGFVRIVLRPLNAPLLYLLLLTRLVAIDGTMRGRPERSDGGLLYGIKPQSFIASLQLATSA